METRQCLECMGHEEAVVGGETGGLDGAYILEGLNTRIQGI